VMTVLRSAVPARPTPATAALKSPLTMRSGTSRGKEVPHATVANAASA